LAPHLDSALLASDIVAELAPLPATDPEIRNHQVA
jgi:hypothetical protein